MLGLGLVLGLFSALLDMLRTRAGCSVVAIVTAKRALYADHFAADLSLSLVMKDVQEKPRHHLAKLRYDTIRYEMLF